MAFARCQAVLIWGWILAAFAVVLVLTAQLWYLPLKYVTLPRPFGAPMKFQLHDAGIYFATGSAKFFLAWKTFRKFKEIGRAFLVYKMRQSITCWQSAI
jgi:hypothetical protein